MAIEKTQLIAQIAQANGVSVKEARKLCEGKTQAQLEAMLSSALSGKMTEYTTTLERTIGKPIKSQTIIQETPDLTEDQTKDLTITFLSKNVISAMDTANSIDNGWITKGYDKLKNLFETRTSSSNVDKVLNNEITSLGFLTRANDNNLTKKEYYEENRERLKQIMLERLQSKDEKTGFDYIDNFTSKPKDKETLLALISKEIDNKIALIERSDGIEGVKYAQRQLLLGDEKEFAPSDFIKNIIKNNTSSIENSRMLLKMDFKYPEITNPQELMKFEEVFKIERGVDYNKENIERLQQSQYKMSFATAAFNKAQSFKAASDELINNDKTPEDVVRLFEDYYHIDKNLAKENLERLIKKQDLDMTVNQNDKGEISIGFGERYKDEKAQNQALNSLLLAGNNAQDEKLKQVLGDKTLEDYASEYQSNYQFAFGARNAQDLAKAMEEDNQTIIDASTQIVTYGGMGLMVVGGVLTLTPLAPLGAGMASAGGKVALAGIATKNLAGLTEAYTRDNVKNEEVTRRYKDLALDIGGLLIGGAAGRQGLKIATNMVNKGSSALVATIAEKGTDFTLSVIGDLAMMGAMGDDLSHIWSQNGVGIVVSTLTGIQTSKTLFKNAAHASSIDISSNPFKHINENPIVRQTEVQTFEAEMPNNKPFQFQNTSAIDNIKNAALEVSNTRSRLFTTPEIQKEVGAHLDNLLKNIKDSPTHNNANSKMKPFQTAMFDDGSCIYLDISNGNHILFYITDSNGNGKNIAATTPENITKAKLLIEQCTQGTIIDKSSIHVIQEKIKETGKPANQLIAEKNAKMDIEQQRSKQEELAKIKSLPATDEILTRTSTKVEAIKLTTAEKIQTKLSGKDEYVARRDKQLNYIFKEASSDFRMSSQITNALEYLNYKVENEMKLGNTYQKIEDYKPIILTDGTTITKTNLSQVPASANAYQILQIKTPDKKVIFLPVSKTNEQYELCNKLLNNLSRITGLKDYKYSNVHSQAVDYRTKMIKNEASIVADIENVGLNKGKHFGHRAKGLSSLYDKIEQEYIKTNDMNKSLKGVRDGVGTRTTLEAFDYKKYPDLVELYKTNPQQAIIKAAEIQSQYYVDKIIDIIKDPNKKLEITSISNYKGKNGIPYFSDAQIESIKDVNLELTIKSGPDATRGSGYTALQMNVKHQDGTISEWQLRGEHVNKFAEYEHIPYDLRENKDITSRTPELKEFYAPFEKMIKEMPKPIFKKYLEFLTDYYHNLRLQELGMEGNHIPFPSGFDPRLSPDGLQKLHDEAETIKKSLENKN